MDFNTAPPTIMHVDINSCFATIEQQANPLLRGKPVVVAAYTTNNGCVLTASKEAKLYGIKTGMRVRDAKYLYPRLIVLPSDPDKYRVVNQQLTALLMKYSPNISVESIDEMVLDLKHTPRFQMLNAKCQMINIAKEIKERIKNEIGDWITVSIGIAPNRYLAKVASGLEKPDGLKWITKETIVSILEKMKLEDLCGIKDGNARRLRSVGIMTPLALFYAEPDLLKRGFHSIVGRQWWLRMHGWAASAEGSRLRQGFGGQAGELKSNKTFGQSYAMSKFLLPTDSHIWQILSQLVMKMGKRLRTDGCSSRGAYISLLFEDHTFWHAQTLQKEPLFADTDFYKKMMVLLQKAPKKPIRIVAISCYQLHKDLYNQQSLLFDENKKRNLARAIDAVQEKYGAFIITPARMIEMKHRVMDRIAFGKTSL